MLFNPERAPAASLTVGRAQARASPDGPLSGGGDPGVASDLAPWDSMIVGRRRRALSLGLGLGRRTAAG